MRCDSKRDAQAIGAPARAVGPCRERGVGLRTMSTSSPVIDPRKYCTPKEASLLFGGLFSAHRLAQLARLGRVRGSFSTGHRTYLLRASLPELIHQQYIEPRVLEPAQALSSRGDDPAPAAERPLVWHDRRAHSTMDGAVQSA